MTTAIHPHNSTSPDVSRRNFLKRVGATGLAVSAFGAVAMSAPASALASTSTTTSPASAAIMPAYRIDCPPSVCVHLTSGRRFDVTVSDLDGNVLETHRRLTSASLQRTESNYFTVTGIAPPS